MSRAAILDDRSVVLSVVEVEELINPPPIGNSMAWANEETCIGDTYSNGIYTKPDDPIDVAIEKLKNAINDERNKRFYTNIPVQFPNGIKVIQMRNEVDRANFANVHQAAITLCLAGQGSVHVSYITEDNVSQSVPASSFLAIGLYVMNEKQNIINTARSKKDSLESMTLEQLKSYDVTSGW